MEDDAKLPSLPADAFQTPTPMEEAIAHNVVNHIEVNQSFTYGRAIEVGFGGTGVWAIHALQNSSWRGRCYTEMLEPFTFDLLEKGQIEGSHFIETDGTRTELDGKVVCTVVIGTEGTDFYKRLDNHPAVVMASAKRVLVPEAFYGGLGINNILGVDFYGQVNANSRFKNYYSGVGGAAVIHRGLMNGGISYFCLKSTYKDMHGKKHSSIYPFSPEGTVITQTGPDLMGGRNGGRCFLVTEHGIAQLSACSQSEFIKALVSVAHPDFRAQLKKKAYSEFRVVV